MIYFIISIIGALGMGILVIFIRLKAQNYPVNEKKIILPPLFMSTGALMYVIPYFRLTGMEIIEAVILGIVFSSVLILTSNFIVKSNQIYMKPSKAFPFILFGLLIIRTIIKIIFSNAIDPGELAGMFFLLAFSMIVPWRIAMLLKYKKIKRKLQSNQI
ncbi:CcdC family protein [Staphylococcus massiliensis]|uniref:Cytochrome C biogenesis protein CcdC n=1 Tax=Staphylococcus massiliensis S46 TaxID=1229783 RepID=K9AGH7_9STAP|nr:CcdC protein domain-containing protein [Staphylococcus massiliensis]EKU46369.1 hypothetical protein C273_09659 [Staphylococcus massiliensis S46]MCG3398649.1 DUF1453 family protein [Staphylococcus massiliensis]MCG3401211.1 DUF1453 family protein [Staphylococcus massiliensis]MCG3412612.1 DUF1453 family protein [Staphylococcus massiliensis]PNZ99427.1 DUF1453 domain-containing protein [Staphylococcus massiliensis CCUG 55927]